MCERVFACDHMAAGDKSKEVEHEAKKEERERDERSHTPQPDKRRNRLSMIVKEPIEIRLQIKVRCATLSAWRVNDLCIVYVRTHAVNA